MPLCKSKSENGTEVEEKVRDGDEEETGGEVGTLTTFSSAQVEKVLERPIFFASDTTQPPV